MKINEYTPLIITEDNLLYINLIERRRFIFKIYITILLELLYTFCFVLLAINVKPINDFMRGDYGFGLLFIVFNLLIILSFSPFSCIDKLKEFPICYIYTFIYINLISYFLFFFVYNVPTKNLLLSGLTTAFVFSGLTIYSFQSKIDFTLFGNYLLLLLLLLLSFSIFYFLFDFSFIQILYPLLGLLVFSVYVIYDTQLIFIKQRIKYKKNDYVIATINIYLDIINLFIFLIELINGR